MNCGQMYKQVGSRKNFLLVHMLLAVAHNLFSGSPAQGFQVFPERFVLLKHLLIVDG